MTASTPSPKRIQACRSASQCPSLCARVNWLTLTPALFCHLYPRPTVYTPALVQLRPSMLSNMSIALLSIPNLPLQSCGHSRP